jgi:hypothetical protein
LHLEPDSSFLHLILLLRHVKHTIRPLLRLFSFITAGVGASEVA